MARAETTARGAAVQLITGVVSDGSAISDLLADPTFLALDPQVRAGAQRLALQVLRHLSKADAVLKPLLRKRPPDPVRSVLRLAVVELLGDGAAAHGVVNEAVALMRAGGRKTASFTGLVNAVLRKVADISPETWHAMPAQPLPGWLRGRLMSAYGKASVQAMERAQAAGAPLDLTPNDGNAAALAERINGDALPTGSVRLVGRVQVSGLPGFAEGEWWVQDAAAALAARVLAAKPTERVLDLCAAPGGKTLQLAAAGAKVTALDISAPRMQRVTENLTRCGLTADLVVADALDWAPDIPFDAVLLDAPCSATGTIRRHPDLPFVRDPGSLKTLFALQAELLDRALAFTTPGGRLVFCTCSLLPEEGEHQIAAALSRHPGLTVDNNALRLQGVDPGWVGSDGGLRLRPDYWGQIGGMDGFFIAVLRKPPV